ncbi:MAG: hypothetical protein AYL32_011130 [Candidatus Bathyarchaeota archaeon B26-2]|nr:MAG: hypothetical protein AYL32_011130 [Candidatus Bathyarchaeota archaeon B26-2]
MDETPLKALVLCLDVSESMGYGDPPKIREAIEASLRAVGGLNRRTHVGVITFDSEADVLQSLQPLDIGKIRDNLRRLRVRGVSCIAAGLKSAIGLLEDIDGGAVLLLTDGRANLSLDRSGGFEGSLSLERELISIAREARRKGIPVHTVSIGEDAFTETLSKVAETTGGLHWISEEFEGISCRPRELKVKVRSEGLIIYPAPAELPSAQPTWTKESQVVHVAVVSESLYNAYREGGAAFIINPKDGRRARTSLISIDDDLLSGYKSRRRKAASYVRVGKAMLLDRSYRDYLNLNRGDEAELVLYQIASTLPTEQNE